MVELKTKGTTVSVAAFLGDIPDATRRQDRGTVFELMRQATNAEPRGEPICTTRFC